MLSRPHGRVALLVLAVFVVTGCEGVRDEIADVVSSASDAVENAGAGDTEAPPAASTAAETEAAVAATTEPAAPTTEPAAPTTEPAAPTAEPTEPAATATEATDEGIDPSLVSFLIVLVLLLIGIVAFTAMRRRSAHAQRGPVATGAGAWQPRARDAYARVRWLQDQLGVDTATWLARHPNASTAPPMEEPQGRAWAEVQRQLPETEQLLYDLEASAPDEADRRAVRQVSSCLADLDRAFDALALQTTGADGAAGAPSESAAATLQDDLHVARARLAGALEALAGRFDEEAGPTAGR
jgi:hypothetical protein